MPTLEKNFDFFIDPSHYHAISEIGQYCNVKYKVDVFSKKVFISIIAITFSVWQLNYCKWSPKMMAEMRDAAIAHYNATKSNKEPVFEKEN